MNIEETLKAENESLKNTIENLNAEKIAIDQVCLNNIKENLQLRTQNILLNEKINKTTSEITELKNRIFNLENPVIDMVSDATDAA